MKIQENLPLLDKKSKSSHKKKILSTVAIIGLTYFVCQAINFGSSPTITAADIPLYTPYHTNDPIMAESERLVFVTHYLSRLLGHSSVSEFSQVIAAWERTLKHDIPNMTYADLIIAKEILSFMQIYETMKENRKFNDPVADVFWARVTTMFQMADGKSLFHDRNGGSEKASGIQLKFWETAEKAIKAFSVPKWVNKEGKLISNHSEIDTQEVNYEGENYWKNSFFNDIHDTKGNRLVDQHIICSQLLMESQTYFEVDNEKSLGGKKKGKFNPDKYVYDPKTWENKHKGQTEESDVEEGEEDGDGDENDFIPIDVPIIKRDGVMPAKYLELLENARLGHKMTAEDQMFSKVVENMIVDWLTKNPKGFFSTYPQASMGNEEVLNKNGHFHPWSYNNYKNGGFVHKGQRTYSQVGSKPLSEWEQLAKWIESESGSADHPNYEMDLFKKFNDRVLEYQAKHNGCYAHHCNAYWTNHAKKIW